MPICSWTEAWFRIPKCYLTFLREISGKLLIKINRHCRNDRGYVKLASKLFQIQFDGHKRLVLWPVEIGKVVAHTMLNTYA